MAEEYRSGLGSIVPTLFIGMGGTGSRIVDRIAERAALLPNWQSQLAPLTRFVAIDTNVLDQHDLRAVPEGNRFNIASFDKRKVIDHFRRSQETQALQWLDRGYQPRGGQTPGAGQIRVESRLGFFYNSPEIRQRLAQLIKEMLSPNIAWRQSTPSLVYVYLFSSLAGGTGSGSFLSMAYLIDDVVTSQGWEPRVIGNLLLSTLMQDVVGPELHSDIHGNTYAALKELEHLTKLDYQEVKDEGRTSEAFAFQWDRSKQEVARVDHRPFYIAFVHDRPKHLGLPGFEAAIADAAFLQLFTPIIEKLAGELDNYAKHWKGLTRFPGELKDVGFGYTKNFGVFGAVALVLPGLDLLEYCAHRFAAQALRSQITFGLDRAPADDDRARALAKLAVDYADVKFLNMSDEGREKAINDAFVASVREMARQDEREEMPEGFWKRLTDRIETGEISGRNEAGELQRGMSLVETVRERLGTDRDLLINRFPIKTSAFVFHREGVNEYVELVSRLKTRIQEARAQIGEKGRALELAAAEGEVVTDFKLDPIAERFLVLRLLEEISVRWIPEAALERKNAEVNDISNPKVRDRLDRELLGSLRDAAAVRRLPWRNDEAFLAVRDEAQDYYLKVAAAADKLHRADLKLAQLRQLETYLKARSRQYARLAGQMNGLVGELERDAERLRRGESAIARPFALRVEVFETLDEPRRRLWDEVYRHVFVEEGRFVATFDRQVLAERISRELKPEVRADGRVVQKPVEKLVTDLRRSLLELGRERLRSGIFGGEDGRPGLDLQRGLRLEALLLLRKDGKEPAERELDAYVERKMRALALLAGVLGRVDAADSRALEDGVVVNSTRQLLIAGGFGSDGIASHFVDRLAALLAENGQKVECDRNSRWHDPRLAVVHDVVMPIPLYYIQPVVGEIEEAYLRLAADEKRPFHLHTTYFWEKSLPNLNPRSSEVAVDWSLRLLAEGLVTGVVQHDGKSWIWRAQRQGDKRELGSTLSSVLYRVSEIHRHRDLRDRFDSRLAEAREALGGANGNRRRELAQRIADQIATIGEREMDGESQRDDLLDRPVLRALLALLRQEDAEYAREPSAVATGYARLGFEEADGEPGP